VIYTKGWNALSQNKIQWALKGIDGRDDWGDVDRENLLKML
jgi:hypothetical protein